MTAATTAPAVCLPGCTIDHHRDGALGFALCDAPVARLVDARWLLVVSATRVAEPGEPVFVSVVVAVDDAEPLELAPGTARRLAAELVRAADVTETGTDDE